MAAVIQKAVDRNPRKKKIIKWSLISLGSLVVISLGVGVWGYLQLIKPLPVTSGEVTVAGLQQPVSVWRDENGVPHIEAENDHDLFFAQGYVTAQDRLFQMDLSRRQASGMLSEVVGSAAVDTDKFFRTFMLRRAGEASYEMYSDEAKAILDAYAAGVNAFMEEAIENGTLPVEFRLMGYEPTPWSSVDSLAIGKFMAFDLGGHWEGQAFRYYLAQNFTDDEVLDLFPSYPEDGPLVLQALREHQMDVPKSFASAVIPDEYNGSNNWVISGDRTETGMPILADDPHLSLATPSIWYETHLVNPSRNVTGVIFAGIPGVILGHNEHIAWGVTNVGPDVQDLYIERRNPDNEYEFEYMGEWEAATVYEEDIIVNGGEEVIPFEVVVTRHGPIISEFAHDDTPDTALSLRWTAHDPSPELEAVLMFSQAENWEEFKEALTYFHTPAQNFVFAAKDGTIAYRANGLIPIRKKGDSSVPVPGWTDEYEWEGYIPWDELPTIVNPPSGFIATANNKIVDDDYPYHITHTWAQPYRQQRIYDVLQSKEILTIEDMKALQFDQKNLQAVEMLPILLGQLNEVDESQLRDMDLDAVQLFDNWDFIDDKDYGAPLLFHLWMLAFTEFLFVEKIDEDMMDMFDGRAIIVDQLIRNAYEGNPGPWVEGAGGFQTVAVQSFQDAVDRIVDMQGNNTANWNWGEFHSIPFNHPLAAISPLDLLFNSKPTPMGGSRVTVMAAGWNTETGAVTHGAGWRGVMDLADLSKSYHVVGPGQSGHVRSPWYHNQIENWTTGKYHVTHLDPAVYQEQSEHLLLKPAE
ncbi:MAG: penicillin acylase family protein [Bacillus sp. (in: Bacteria)]|nr:penicillin acylase family protein [Bacillus sp. (in: firmicutes)]